MYSNKIYILYKNRIWFYVVYLFCGFILISFNYFLKSMKPKVPALCSKAWQNVSLQVWIFFLTLKKFYLNFYLYNYFVNIFLVINLCIWKLFTVDVRDKIQNTRLVADQRTCWPRIYHTEIRSFESNAVKILSMIFTLDVTQSRGHLIRIELTTLL